MGILDSLKSIGRAVKDTAMTPIDTIVDVATGGGDIVNGGDSHLERRVKKIGRGLSEAYKETHRD